MSATADTSRLKKMREEIENRDLIAESWQEVGDSMREAMTTLDQEMGKGNSSR